MTTPQVGISQTHQTLPFMTVAMYRRHPTGIATDNLVPRGTPQMNDDQLARMIRQASAEANSYCYGASGGVLHATTDTQTLRTRIDRYGRFNLNPPFTPVLALSAFSYGDDPAAMTALTDLSHVQVEKNRLVVPAYPFLGTSSAGPLQFGAGGPINWPLIVNYSYVNGWPMTFLSATVTAGATSFQVTDATGIFPNLTSLVFRDPAVGDENVLVTGVNGTTISCQPLQKTHTVGNGAVVQVDALHEDIITSCVELTNGLMKRKAAESMQAKASSRSSSGDIGPGDDNFAAGFDMLREFVQVRWR